MTGMKFGRLPRTYNPAIPHLSAMMMGAPLPPPPATVDWAQGVNPNWGTMLNDQLGDCLTEGVIVASGGVHKAYRGRYDGPIAILTTASGKKLPVTPNHAVLTELGFGRAASLKKGDNLIGTSRPEVFPGTPIVGGETNFNQSPPAIEEIFAAFALRRNPVRKVMPTAVNFHGDEQFIDSNIDVVGADRFLRRQIYSPLRQPHAQNQVSATRELQRHLMRARAAFLAHLRGFAATFSDVGFGSHGSALGYAHAGISQSYSLSQSPQFMPCTFNRQLNSVATDARLYRQTLDCGPRNVALDNGVKISISAPRSYPAGLADSPEFHASSPHPTTDGHRTDPCLGGDLINRFPDLIEIDQLIDVDFQMFHGQVYDLSTQSRWYSANGIIAHNCTCAAAYHAMQLWSANGRSHELTEPDAKVLTMYEEFCGYDPSHPASDRGGVEQSVLSQWHTEGVPIIEGPNGRSKLRAFFEVDPRNMDDVKNVIAMCGCVYIGFNVPAFLTSGPMPLRWDYSYTSGDEAIVGGHAVIATGYDPDLHIVSWGSGAYRMTWAFWDKFVVECYACIHPWWIEATGKTPFGMTEAQLDAAMSAL